jgi:transposase
MSGLRVSLLPSARLELEHISRLWAPGYVHDRVRALLDLFSSGGSFTDVARRHGCCRQSLAGWAEAFVLEGRAALFVGAGRGARRRLSDAGLELLAERCRQPPRAFGFEAERWTLSMLAAATPGLEQASPETVRRYLIRLGLAYTSAASPSSTRLTLATRLKKSLRAGPGAL